MYSKMFSDFPYQIFLNNSKNPSKDFNSQPPLTQRLLMLRLCYFLLFFLSSLSALPSIPSTLSSTNTISTTQWNQRENAREALRGNGVLREGNEYNSKAFLGELSGSGERDNSVLRVGASALKISKRIYSFYQLGNRLPNLKELGDMIASEGKAIAQDVGILVGEASSKEKLDALFRVVVGLDSNDLKNANAIYKKITGESETPKQEGGKGGDSGSSSSGNGGNNSNGKKGNGGGGGISHSKLEKPIV